MLSRKRLLWTVEQSLI